MIGCAVDEQQETSSEERSSQILVCDECLKCYKVADTNELKRDSSPSSQLVIGRPTKFKVNFEFIQEIVQFLGDINLINSSQPTPATTTTTNRSNDHIEKMFALNTAVSTSQLVFEFDFDQMPNMTLNLSLNQVSVLANKTRSIDYDCVLKSYTNSDFLHLNVKLSDFVCALDYLPEDKFNKANGSSCLHFVGPISVRSYLDYSTTDNELFAFVDFGSFNVSFNRFIYEYYVSVQAILDDYFSKVNIVYDHIQIYNILICLASFKSLCSQ